MHTQTCLHLVNKLTNIHLQKYDFISSGFRSLVLFLSAHFCPPTQATDSKTKAFVLNLLWRHVPTTTLASISNVFVASHYKKDVQLANPWACILAEGARFSFSLWILRSSNTQWNFFSSSYNNT
jgi:hypothetical protein